MAAGEERRGREAAVGKFPAGLRVLAVDDDPVCLKLLETLLRLCSYHATMARDAKTALRMLREGKDQFDLVISDVHMPDMDGFRLLELIGLEMDLPVIMLSANGETETVMKGITHGACDYLVKPVRAKELKNIWQHVVRRRKPDLRNVSNGGNDDADQKVQSGRIAEGEQGGAKSTRKYSRKKKNAGDDSVQNEENVDLSTQKKTRVVWTSELHGRFLEVVNRIGIDRAVPKKILDMMNVDYITRESVASHLQKYRLYLNRVSGYTRRKSNPFGDASERCNSSYNTMNELESFKHHHGHRRWQPSLAIASLDSCTLFARMNSTHGMLPTGSGQVRNSQSNLCVGTVAHGGSMLKDAASVSLLPDPRKCPPSDHSANSLANTSNEMMLDASSSCHSGKSYANILRDKLLEASKGIPFCHTGNSLANIENGRMLVPVNQLWMQSPHLGNQPSVQMNSSSAHVFSGTLVSDASPYPDLGNCSNSWQTAELSNLPDLGHKDGTSLGPLQVNIPKINQLRSFAASSSKMPMFQNDLQNQMAAIMSKTASMAGFSEQTVPFNNIASHTSSTVMPNGNFALGNASSTGSTLPDLQIGSSVMPTQMLNGGDAGGILPVQEGTVDQEAVDDQLSYNNDFIIGTNGLNRSGSLDDIVASMLNQDFIDDDAFMDGDW